MATDPGGSWQQRYEAGAARERQSNAAWVRDRYAGPAHQTLLREAPLVIIVGAMVLILVGWPGALIAVAVQLCLIFAFRGWARRRYGVGRPTEDPETQ